MESTISDRLRLGFPEYPPLDLQHHMSEVAELLGDGSVNCQLGAAIASIQQGGTRPIVVPFYDQTRTVVSSLEVSPWVKLWNPITDRNGIQAVRVVESAMQQPVPQAICVPLHLSACWRPHPSRTLKFKQPDQELHEHDSGDDHSIMIWIVSKLVRRYLSKIYDELIIQEENPCADEVLVEDILIQPVGDNCLDAGRYNVSVSLVLQSHTSVVLLKTAITQHWLDHNRGVLGLGNVTDSVHFHSGGRTYGRRNIGWVQIGNIGRIPQHPPHDPEHSTLATGSLRVVLLFLECDASFYVFIPGTPQSDFYASDLIWSPMVTESFKQSTTNDLWYTSDGMSWLQYLDLLVLELSYSLCSSVCTSLPRLSIPGVWRPLSFTGIQRAGVLISDGDQQDILTLLQDLHNLCSLYGFVVGFTACTQNANGLVHRIGESSSKLPDRKADLLMYYKAKAPDVLSFTEAHQPSVKGYYGSSQLVDSLNSDCEFGTNPLEPAVVDFFRSLGVRTVMGSGASLRRMGVLSTCNQPVERVWSSYDVFGPDYELGCLRANARMVAFVMRVDDGYLLRVSIYAPNSGGTSPDASKSSCTRMALKLMCYQKLSIFTQMVNDIYPGVRVLIDGDFNCIHEGPRQGVIRTMDKSKKSRPTLHIGSRFFHFGMSGCTKDERLGLCVFQETTGLSSAFNTAHITKRVESDNLTAGLSNFVTTEQVKHCLRFPVIDIAGTSPQTIAITEDDCLKGRDLLAAQLCLDHVLHSPNLEVSVYSIPPSSHPSDPTSRGSDHKDTTAFCLQVSATLWSRIDLSATIGTHPFWVGYGIPNTSGSQPSVPFPGTSVQTYKRGKPSVIIVVRTPVCVSLHSALLSACPNILGVIPRFTVVQKWWSEYCSTNTYPGKSDSNPKWDWCPRPCLPWSTHKQALHHSTLPSPFGGCLESVVTSLCSNHALPGPVSNTHNWAVVELVSSWMLSHRRRTLAYFTIASCRAWAPANRRLEHTHRWRLLTAPSPSVDTEFQQILKLTALKVVLTRAAVLCEEGQTLALTAKTASVMKKIPRIARNAWKSADPQNLSELQKRLCLILLTEQQLGIIRGLGPLMIDIFFEWRVDANSRKYSRTASTQSKPFSCFMLSDAYANALFAHSESRNNSFRNRCVMIMDRWDSPSLVGSDFKQLRFDFGLKSHMQDRSILHCDLHNRVSSSSYPYPKRMSQKCMSARGQLYFLARSLLSVSPALSLPRSLGAPLHTYAHIHARTFTATRLRQITTARALLKQQQLVDLKEVLDEIDDSLSIDGPGATPQGPELLSRALRVNTCIQDLLHVQCESHYFKGEIRLMVPQPTAHWTTRPEDVLQMQNLLKRVRPLMETLISTRWVAVHNRLVVCAHRNWVIAGRRRSALISAGSVLKHISLLRLDRQLALPRSTSKRKWEFLSTQYRTLSSFALSLSRPWVQPMPYTQLQSGSLSSRWIMLRKQLEPACDTALSIPHQITEIVSGLKSIYGAHLRLAAFLDPHRLVLQPTCLAQDSHIWTLVTLLGIPNADFSWHKAMHAVRAQVASGCSLDDNDLSQRVQRGSQLLMLSPPGDWQPFRGRNRHLLLSALFAAVSLAQLSVARRSLGCATTLGRVHYHVKLWVTEQSAITERRLMCADFSDSYAATSRIRELIRAYSYHAISRRAAELLCPGAPATALPVRNLRPANPPAFTPAVKHLEFTIGKRQHANPYSAIASLVVDIREEIRQVLGPSVLATYGKYVPYVNTAAFLSPPGLVQPQPDLPTVLTVQKHTFASNRQGTDQVLTKAELLGVSSHRVNELWAQVDFIRKAAVDHEGDISAARNTVLQDKESPLLVALRMPQGWTAAEGQVVSYIRTTSTIIDTQIQVNIMDPAQVSAAGSLGKATALYFMAYIQPCASTTRKMPKRVLARCMLDSGANISLVNHSFLLATAASWGVVLEDLFSSVNPCDLPDTSGAFGSSSKAMGLVRLDLWAPTIPASSAKWGTETPGASNSNDSKGFTRQVDLYSYSYVCTDIILGTNWSGSDLEHKEDIAIAHSCVRRGAVVTVKCGGTSVDQLEFGVGCIPAGMTVSRNARFPVLAVALSDVSLPVGLSTITVVLTGGVGMFDQQGGALIVEPTSMHPEVHAGVSGLRIEGSSPLIVTFQPSLFACTQISNHNGVSTLRLPVCSEWGGHIRAGDSIAVVTSCAGSVEVEGPQSMASGDLGKVASTLAMEWYTQALASTAKNELPKEVTSNLTQEHEAQLPLESVVATMVRQIDLAMRTHLTSLRKNMNDRRKCSPEMIHQYVRMAKVHIAALEVLITSHPELGVPTILRCKEKSAWIEDFEWLNNYKPPAWEIDNEWESMRDHISRLGKIIHFRCLKMGLMGTPNTGVSSIHPGITTEEYGFNSDSDRLMWDSIQPQVQVVQTDQGGIRVAMVGHTDLLDPQVFGIKRADSRFEANTVSYSWQRTKDCSSQPPLVLHSASTMDELLAAIDEWLRMPALNSDAMLLIIREAIVILKTNPSDQQIVMIHVLTQLFTEISRLTSSLLGQEDPRLLAILHSVWAKATWVGGYDHWAIDYTWRRPYNPALEGIEPFVQRLKKAAEARSDLDFVSQMVTTLSGFLQRIYGTHDVRERLMCQVMDLDPNIQGFGIDREKLCAHIVRVCLQALIPQKSSTHEAAYLASHIAPMLDLMKDNSAACLEADSVVHPSPNITMAAQFCEQTGTDTMWTVDELVRQGVPTLAFIHGSLIDDSINTETDVGFVLDYSHMELPVSLRKEEHSMDPDWWLSHETHRGCHTLDKSYPMRVSSHSKVEQQIHQLYCASCEKFGVVEADVLTEESAMERGITMVDDTQEMIDPKPETQPMSDLAKRALNILDHPKYKDLWDKLPNKKRFRNHIESLKEGQIHTTRFLEPLLHLWITEPSVFDTDPDCLTTTHVLKLTAKMAGLDMTKPINEPARAIPPGMETEVETLLNQYIKMGIVEPDFGPWNSSSVFVVKKDGVNRWCIDYRRINERMSLIPYPQGTVIQAVTTAAGHRVYTTVDAISAFHQIEAAECIRPALAFTVGSNKYRWTRHPFGLQTGVQCFTHCMQLALGDLKSQAGYHKYKGGVVNWVDDITLFSSHQSHNDPKYDHEEIHWKLYQEFHHRMHTSRIQLKLKKCEFFSDHSDMLGWVCNFEGYQGEDKKIKAIQSLPDELKDQKEVQRLVGSLVYYRLMHPAAADELEPLTRLLGKGKSFIWGPEQSAAVRRAKQILTGTTIMKSPDFSPNAGRFCLGVDASGVGYGAVLCQEEIRTDGSVVERPISYASKTLSLGERRRCATERELAAVDWAVSQFSGYLIGAPTFKVWTDCRPLEAMFKKKPKNGRHYSIVLNLQMYDFTIEHRRASCMVVPDMLSRPPFAQALLSDDGEDDAKEVRTEVRDETLELENSKEEVCCLQNLCLRRNGGKDPRCDVTPVFTYKVEGRDTNGIVTDAPFRWEVMKNVPWTSTEPVHIWDLAKKYGQELKDDVHFVMHHATSTYQYQAPSDSCRVNTHAHDTLPQPLAFASIQASELKPTALIGFCGGGGDTFGFKEAGFEILAGAEKVEKIRKLWESIFQAPTFSDVGLLSNIDFASVFTFSSSSPCTDMSPAGLQKGWMGLRTALYISQVTKAIEARVPCIHLEQVVAATKIFKGQETLGSPQSVLEEKLSRAGYHVFSAPINAAFVGGSVDRERLHTVAVSDELFVYHSQALGRQFDFKLPHQSKPVLKHKSVVSQVAWPPPDDSLVMVDSELHEFHMSPGTSVIHPRNSHDIIHQGDQCTAKLLAPGAGPLHSRRRIRGRPMNPGVSSPAVNEPVSFKVADRGRSYDLGFSWSGNCIYHAGGMLRSVTAAGQTYWWYMEAPENSPSYKHPSWSSPRNWCVRRLSSDEVAELMGFRNSCALPPSTPDQLKAHVVGNAVNVDCARAIASEIKKQLWDEAFFAQHFRRQNTQSILQSVRNSKDWDVLDSQLHRFSRTAEAPYMCQPRLLKESTEVATWMTRPVSVPNPGGVHTNALSCSSIETTKVVPGQEKRDLIAHYMSDPKVSVIAVTGPQGTGKTYTAILAILDEIMKGRVQKLFVSRTNIGTGDTNGLVPGTFAMKMKNLTAPIITSMEKAMTQRGVDSRMRARILEEIIEVVPADQIRGWNIGEGEVFLLDEAQNTTDALMKVFMGRVGTGKVVLTGDPTGQPDKACCVGMRFLLQRVKKLANLEGKDELKRHIAETFRHIEFSVDDNCRSTSSKGMGQLYDIFSDPATLVNVAQTSGKKSTPILVWRHFGDQRQLFLTPTGAGLTLIRGFQSAQSFTLDKTRFPSLSDSFEQITQTTINNQLLEFVQLKSPISGPAYSDPGEGTWVTVGKGCRSVQGFHSIIPAQDFDPKFRRDDRVLIGAWLRVSTIVVKDELNLVSHDEPRDCQISDLREGTGEMDAEQYELYRSVSDGIFPSYPTRFLAEFVNAWGTKDESNPMCTLLNDTQGTLVNMCEELVSGSSCSGDANVPRLFEALSRDANGDGDCLQHPEQPFMLETEQDNRTLGGHFSAHPIKTGEQVDASSLLFTDSPVRAYRSDCRARMALIERGIQIAIILNSRCPEYQPIPFKHYDDPVREVRVNSILSGGQVLMQPESSVAHSLSEWSTVGGESKIEKLQRLQQADSFCGSRIQLLDKGIYPTDLIERRTLCTDKRQFSVIKGLLHIIENVPSESGNNRRVAKLVVPNDLKSLLTLAMHRDPLTMAHFGIEKTYSKMTQRFWWDGMHADCEWIISSCPLCSRLKRGRRTSSSQVQFIPAGSIGETVGVDWTGPIGPGPTKQGNSYALSIVDWFSQEVEYYACKNNSADTCAACLIDYISRHGAPRRICTDRGQEFLNNVIARICRTCGVEQTATVAYNPRCNGAVERSHSTYAQLLRVLGQNREWDECLTFCRAAYSAAPNLIHGFSPFFVAHLREFQTPVESVLTVPIEDFEDPHDYVSRTAIHVRKTMDFLRNKREQFKQSVIDRVNKTIKDDHVYKAGDLVLIFVPVRPKAGSKKLSAYRWHGPHAIESRHGPATYVIKLLHSDRDLSRYRVVNQSRLKPYRDAEGITQVKQFLSKEIAPIHQTLEMLDAFDRATIDPSALDPSLGKFGEVEIAGNKVVLLPTGLSLPVDSFGEGRHHGFDYKWAWENGEGAMIDEDRGPERGAWVTDRPLAPKAQTLPEHASLGGKFLDSLVPKKPEKPLEFTEDDEDDPITIRAKVATPTGCTWIVLQRDDTVSSVAKQFALPCRKLVGVNFANPAWKPLAVAPYGKSVGTKLLKAASIVWIPDAHYASVEKGQSSLEESVVDAIIGQRRLHGVKQYLVQWQPTTRTSASGQLVTDYWDDTWEDESNMNCAEKIQQFEHHAAATIGLTQ